MPPIRSRTSPSRVSCGKIAVDATIRSSSADHPDVLHVLGLMHVRPVHAVGRRRANLFAHYPIDVIDQVLALIHPHNARPIRAQSCLPLFIAVTQHNASA